MNHMSRLNPSMPGLHIISPLINICYSIYYSTSIACHIHPNVARDSLGGKSHQKQTHLHDCKMTLLVCHTIRKLYILQSDSCARIARAAVEIHGYLSCR